MSWSPWTNKIQHSPRLHFIPDRVGGAWFNFFAEAAHLQVCVSTLWHRYTYGKPVQGKIDITFLTSLQFFERDFSNSTEMRKKQSWVGGNMREWKVSPDGNVCPSVLLICLTAPLMYTNLFNLVSSHFLDLIDFSSCNSCITWITFLAAHIWLSNSGEGMSSV